MQGRRGKCLLVVVSCSTLLTAQIPTFEVASVKPNKTDAPQTVPQMQLGGRMNLLNRTLRYLVQFAYSSLELQLHDLQIVGGPDWIDRESGRCTNAHKCPEESRCLITCPVPLGLFGIARENCLGPTILSGGITFSGVQRRARPRAARARHRRARWNLRIRAFARRIRSCLRLRS